MTIGDPLQFFKNQFAEYKMFKKLISDLQRKEVNAPNMSLYLQYVDMTTVDGQNRSSDGG